MKYTIKRETNKLLCLTDNNKQQAVTIDVLEKSHVTVAAVIRESTEYRLVVNLLEPMAHAEILMLVNMKGKSTARIHTLQHHKSPDTTSNLLIKSALSGNAMFSYTGTIVVKKHAQRTQAYQHNDNILLSTGVHVESKPILEIQANDVRCTHGATMSSVDRDQLYYVRSRGITEDVSQSMIVYGFLTDPLSMVADKEIQRSIIHKLYS